MMLLHGSQASPLPSPSASSCPGFATFLQLSALSQRPSPSMSMTPVSAGHVALAPSHVSAGSQLPVDARQTNPFGRIASAGQLTLEPSQFSATSQPPVCGRQTVVLGWKASLGQLGPVPVQVSSTSQSPAAGRQTAPALPAGCWQASLEPSHSSTVHGFPSLVHAVPAGLFASEGQFGPVPVQFSAGSHTPADARHWVKAERNPSAGQVVPEPVQVSTSSQGPAAARHTAPALPAGCWQLSLLPSHSSRLQGFPSLVQAVPAGCFASAGQTVLDPVQVSARSHSPAVGRHVAPAFPAGCWQASLEPSHASVLHGLPSSVHPVPAALFASAGRRAAGPVPC